VLACQWVKEEEAQAWLLIPYLSPRRVLLRFCRTLWVGGFAGLSERGHVTTHAGHRVRPSSAARKTSPTPTYTGGRYVFFLSR